MNYRVIWMPRVRSYLDSHLFIIREKGGDPMFLDRATDAVEALLAREPKTAGESRGDNERVVFVDNLNVVYEAFDSERVVLIYSAKVTLPR